MKKNEFIKNLSDALEGNVSNSEMASQIAYYNDYVDSEIRKGKTEDEVIDSLGDPRLIAKTIIDLSGESGGNYVYESEEPAHSKNSNSNFKSYKINSWYTKLIVALIVLAFIVIVVVIGGIIGFVLLKFAIPIIIIIVFLSMFRKR